MLAMCFSTAPTVSTSDSAMPAFDRPSAISASTSRSRGVSSSSGPSSRRLREQLGDDLGVERGAAAGDPLDRLQEVGDVHDPVLEQVADPAAAVGEQLLGVGRLDVLGDDQHRRPGRLPAHLERGAQALVAEPGGRRMSTTARSGPLRDHLAHQRVGVVDGGHHRRSRCRAAAAQSVAQQREVLGDHYPQGSSALTVVGPPRGLITCSVPSSASTRRRSPLARQPRGRRRRRRRRAPRPKVAAGSGDPDVDAVAWACLAALARASATTK